MKTILELIQARNPNAVLLRTVTYLSHEGTPRLEAAVFVTRGDESYRVARREAGRDSVEITGYSNADEACGMAAAGNGPHVVARPNDELHWDRGGQLDFYVLIEGNPLRLEVRPKFLSEDWTINWPGMGAQSLMVTTWFNRALNYALDRAASRNLLLC